jgi:hypothetical protein
VLKAGAYTGAAGQLSIGNTGEIEVKGGGVITIAGGGELELTKALSKVVLLAGGAIDIKTATGKFGESDQTETQITVEGTEGNAKVVKEGTIWTVTDDDTGDNISASNKIILGTLTLDFNGTSAVNNDPCAASGGSAAGGKLIAGAGTTITFIGTD